MWLPGFSEAAADTNPGYALMHLLGPQDILALAPAGCGKTRALAARAQSLVQGGAVPPPRRILALTFSNRARENLRTQLRALMGPAYRSRVTVANFHGFAGRIIRSHGSALGIGEDMSFPERGWRARALQGIVADRRRLPEIDATFRTAKSRPVDDAVVMAQLEQSGVAEAVEFEKLLRRERRLDFDDLLRHAERLLTIPAIARLYRSHFSAVFVDEVQDLTEQQLRLALLVGESRLTATGDPDQGIYGFAGANVDHVVEALMERNPAVVHFDRSYRSAPAVLRTVSRLASELGGTSLDCANPEDWPDEGHVMMLRRETMDDEARFVADHLRLLTNSDPTATAGVIARRGDRRMRLQQLLLRAGIDFEAWDVPAHSPKMLALLRGSARTAIESSPDPDGQIAALENLAKAALDPDDFDARDDVSGACSSLSDFLAQGLTLEEALARCRAAPPVDAPVSPGIHLLNAHLGKGQQFDWVCVLGLEEGHMPDFRATTAGALAEELRVLHVMVSRARRGVVLTAVRRTQNQYGRWFDQMESRWLPLLEETVTDHL
jgi:DNA helicase-2/ATP-dependent DNA helicase PcrA